MNNKLVNGNLVALTAQEEVEVKAREEAWTSAAFDRQLASLTAERDLRLRETDHLFLTDSPIASLEMQTYRANLRTLFNGATTIADLNAIVFPNKPAE